MPLFMLRSESHFIGSIGASSLHFWQYKCDRLKRNLPQFKAPRAEIYLRSVMRYQFTLKRIVMKQAKYLLKNQNASCLKMSSTFWNLSCA